MSRAGGAEGRRRACSTAGAVRHLPRSEERRGHSKHRWCRRERRETEGRRAEQKAQDVALGEGEGQSRRMRMTLRSWAQVTWVRRASLVSSTLQEGRAEGRWPWEGRAHHSAKCLLWSLERRNDAGEHSTARPSLRRRTAGKSLAEIEWRASGGRGSWAPRLARASAHSLPRIPVCAGILSTWVGAQRRDRAAAISLQAGRFLIETWAARVDDLGLDKRSKEAMAVVESERMRRGTSGGATVMAAASASVSAAALHCWPHRRMEMLRGLETPKNTPKPDRARGVSGSSVEPLVKASMEGLGRRGRHVESREETECSVCLDLGSDRV